jgi:hypothetical protein
VADGDFSADVQEISYDQIPMLDAASAEKLGTASWVALRHGPQSKWRTITPRSTTTAARAGDPPGVTGHHQVVQQPQPGLPAYLVIDMVTQNVEVVRLDAA